MENYSHLQHLQMTNELYLQITDLLSNLIAGTKFENNLFCVGGCCRDSLMGNEIKDIDLVVSLPNGGIELAETLYAKNLLIRKPIVYEAFGTSMFVLRAFPNVELEAVQTRSEKYCNRDSRKPSTEFGNINSDCLRRDLTINALYYNVSTKKMMDICGTSIADLNTHIIRTPDEPNNTYNDDPLRILRCIRFACKYGWEIDTNTFDGMKDNAYRITIVSRERINVELHKIFEYDAYRGFKLLYEIDILKYIFPNLYGANIVLESLKMRTVSLESIYSIILYNSNNTEFGTEYRLENDLRNEIYLRNSLLKSYIETMIHEKSADATIRLLQYKAKTQLRFYEVMSDANALITALFPQLKECVNKNFNDCMSRMFTWEQNNIPSMFGYVLPVNGNDLLSLGFKGKEIRQMQLFLLANVFENPTLTKEELLKIATNKC